MKPHKRSCSLCGRTVDSGDRCELHKRPARTGSYHRAAAKVRASAERCWICCGTFDDPNDPPVADHVVPRLLGGSDRIENLAPAHKSCNGRRGQRIARA